MRFANKDLYIVNTPLQLICAAEVYHASGKRPSVVVFIRVEEGRTLDQIRALIPRLDLDGAEKLFLGKSAFYFTAMWLLRKLVKTPVKRLFIGNAGSWMHELFYVSPISEEVVFLDDGVATLEYYWDGQSRKSELSSGKIFLFSLLVPGFNKRAGLMKTYYTFFPLEDSKDIKVRQHDFEQFRKIFSVESLSSIGSDVGFLGQPYRTAEEYDQLQKQIACVISRHPGQRIVYFSHRKERRDQLEKVFAGMPVDIYEAQWPVEIDVALSDGRFGFFYSFISTALFTLKKMFPSLDVFRIDDQVMGSDTRYYERISEAFARIGVESVTLIEGALNKK